MMRVSRDINDFLHVLWRGLVGAAIITALCMWLATHAEARRQWRGPTQYAQTVSVTATNTAITFGFDAFDVLIVNDGSNEVFVQFGATTATSGTSSSTAVNANGMQVLSGESIALHFTSPVQGVGIVCSSAETASVRLGAWR